MPHGGFARMRRLILSSQCRKIALDSVGWLCSASMQATIWSSWASAAAYDRPIIRWFSANTVCRARPRGFLAGRADSLPE